MEFLQSAFTQRFSFCSTSKVPSLDGDRLELTRSPSYSTDGETSVQNLAKPIYYLKTNTIHLDGHPSVVLDRVQALNKLFEDAVETFCASEIHLEIKVDELEFHDLEAIVQPNSIEHDHSNTARS